MSAIDNPLGGPPKRSQRYWETSDFWKDAGERIVTGFIGGATTVITLDWVVGAFGKAFPTDWWLPPLAGGIMGVVEAVKALIGAQRKGTTTPVSIV